MYEVFTPAFIIVLVLSDPTEFSLLISRIQIDYSSWKKKPDCKEAKADLYLPYSPILVSFSSLLLHRISDAFLTLTFLFRSLSSISDYKNFLLAEFVKPLNR